MTQEELYELAKKLSDKEVAYLVCAHLEHIRKCEMGWKINASDRVFDGVVKCTMKTLGEI